MSVPFEYTNVLYRIGRHYIVDKRLSECRWINILFSFYTFSAVTRPLLFEYQIFLLLDSHTCVYFYVCVYSSFDKCELLFGGVVRWCIIILLDLYYSSNFSNAIGQIIQIIKGCQRYCGSPGAVLCLVSVQFIYHRCLVRGLPKLFNSTVL